MNSKNLQGSYLPNMNGSNLSESDLIRSKLLGTKIYGINLTDTKLDKILMKGSFYDENTSGLSNVQKAKMLSKDQLSLISQSDGMFKITDDTHIISDSNCIKDDTNLLITYGNVGLGGRLVGLNSPLVILKNAQMANLDWTNESTNLTNNNFEDSDFSNTNFGSNNFE